MSFVLFALVFKIFYNLLPLNLPPIYKVDVLSTLPWPLPGVPGQESDA